jgi:predicted ABC-type ATPase
VVGAYLNADEIARELNPVDPESVALRAGRVMLQKMRSFIQSETSFAMETTCSGKSYVPMLAGCKSRGWRISLLYLWVPSPEYSIARVARRVSHGGHSIPDEVVHRRYWSGLWNMRNQYLPLAELATIYDNRDSGLRLVARLQSPLPLKVFDQEIWSKIEEGTDGEHDRAGDIRRD